MLFVVWTMPSPSARVNCRSGGCRLASTRSPWIPQGFARRWVGLGPSRPCFTQATVLSTRPFTEFDSIHTGHFYLGAPFSRSLLRLPITPTGPTDQTKPKLQTPNWPSCQRFNGSRNCCSWFPACAIGSGYTTTGSAFCR